jgi:uncharacterized protein
MNEKNKWIASVITIPVLFFALLFVYTKFAGPLPLSVTSVVTNKSDLFSVSGEGKVTVTPDIATITVGVLANGPTVKQVKNDLNAKINAVSEAVKKLGVSDKDIQTNNYSIYPTYDYRSNVQKITGYSANTNLLIKVRDLDKVNDVLDTATEKGANTVGGVSFDIEDKTKAQNDAREKAVAEAKRKAQEASRIAGFRLGKIVNYAESFGNSPRAYPVAMEKAMDSGIGGGAPTQVEPGSQEINITVSLSYQLE